jgi:hypothetical protein
MRENPGGSSAPFRSTVVAGTVTAAEEVATPVAGGVVVSVGADVEVGVGAVGVLVEG